MQNFNKKLAELARSLGKPLPDFEKIDYQSIRQQYQQQANEDVRKQQQQAKQQRIQAIHGRSDLNPKWVFDNLIEDSQDVIDAISIAKSFIAAHGDPNWRNNASHMMIFYGDYGRGKSHIAGAIAHELIDKYETTVLYRQLSSLLEMRFFSYDYSATDNIGEQFRKIQQELHEVDLLILDEVCVNESVLKQSAQSWLGNLLRQRLANRKNCILITNHNLNQLEQALGNYCFESIKEYDTYKVQFSGPSRRQSITPQQPETEPVRQSGYQPNQVK